MSRILGANGAPVDAPLSIARPGETRVNFASQPTPLGVALAITIGDQPAAVFPLSVEVACRIGVELIANAGQHTLLVEQEKARQKTAQDGNGAVRHEETAAGNSDGAE